MAVKTLSYLELSPEDRKVAARQARERLRGLMANPLLTPENRETLADHLAHLDDWEAGKVTKV